MSRFNYCDDEDFSGQFELWQANVRRCLQGKKGKKALIDFRESLMALPSKRLISDSLYDAEGEVCAVGAYGKYKGIDLNKFDPEDATDEAGRAMGLPYMVAWTLIEMNDHEFNHVTPEERYSRMLAWVEKELAVA